MVPGFRAEGLPAITGAAADFAARFCCLCCSCCSVEFSEARSVEDAEELPAEFSEETSADWSSAC